MFDAEDNGRVGLARWLDDGLIRLENWRYRSWLVGGLVAAVLAAVGIGLLVDGPGGPPAEDLIPLATEATTASSVLTDAPSAPSSSTTTEADLVVHVTGAVRRPGLVRVRPGARIDDVVAAAGGPSEGADVNRLNLARPVADGMQIRVPLQGEDDVALPLVSDPSSADPGVPAVEVGPVNLNTASAATLDTLPGVGPATASAILAWRDENGGFRVVDDLLDVPGIGPAKLETLRDHVVV